LKSAKITVKTQDEKNEVVYGILELILTPDQRWILIIMAFNWFVMTLTLYGINFNVSNFGTNPFLTGVIIYLSESLGQMLCLYFILNYGFRNTLCGCYILSAVTLTFLNLFDTDTHSFTKFFFIFLAKFGVSGVNICNYIFTAEMFPTLMRVAAMSFCSLMSRFGGISSTIVIEMTDYAMTFFGLLCLFTSIILYKNEKIRNL
jgi:hypothetical protein